MGDFMNDNQDLIQARVDTHTYYEVLTNATTKLQEYLKKIKRHEKEQPVPQMSDNAIFDVPPLYQNIFSTLVSWVEPLELKESYPVSEVPQTMQPPARPAAPSLYSDLPLYVAERNRAFLNYMQALKREHEILMPFRILYSINRARLTTTLEMITPYIKPLKKAKNAILRIDIEIERVRATKRSWYDYLRDSFLSLIYGFTKYQPFHLRLQERLKQLASNLAEANQVLLDLEKSLSAKWEETFSEKLPTERNSFFLAASFLKSMVDNYDDAELSKHFDSYQKDQTVDNLFIFYRQACFLQLDKNSDKLSNIDDYLFALHPDMRSDLKLAAAMVKKEHALKTLIHRAAITPRDHRSDVFLKAMIEKYSVFLKQKNHINFYPLYHAVSTSQSFINDAIREDIKNRLNALYPEAVAAYNQQFVAHINQKECQDFLKKYEKMNDNHPFYTKMMQFARVPTWFNFSLFEAALNDACDQSFYQDPNMNAAMQEFIKLCSKTPQLTQDMQCIGGEESHSVASTPRTRDNRLPTKEIIDGLHEHHMFKHVAVDPSSVGLLGSHANLIEEQTPGYNFPS